MADKPKFKKKQVRIPYSVFVVVTAIIVLAGVILISQINKKVDCTTEKCFDNEFSLCQPAEWTDQESTYPDAQESYKINNKVGNSSCSVTFTDSQTSSVHITCNFDNKLSFSEAQNLAINDTKKYDCRKT